MTQKPGPNNPLKQWLSKTWVQWALATVIFFGLSWFYMGSAITSCATTSTALGSDTTGGLGWVQWAAGNDMSWGHTDKSNFPYGETLAKPQHIAGIIFIVVFKFLSMLTTPICGLNLMVLGGYMSSALVMFGLVKWLLKRADIALFAGYAAAFVPFHTQKAQSHINYVYGSIFIAIVWAYLWFISKPSYRRAILLAIVCSTGFYFDGYFVFMSSALIGGLFTSSFVFDFLRLIFGKNKRQILKRSLKRAKYLAISTLLLGVLLVPILMTYVKNGDAINQTLATVRSDIKSETLLYGVRPIEFILPGYNNPLAPSDYPAWRATKLHGSNYSESTLYMGYTVIILALASIAYLVRRRYRSMKLQGLPYGDTVFTMVYAFLVCFAVSLPAVVTIFGYSVHTPVAVFIKLTRSWRVLSRLFLVMDPLAIILASLGLYMVTKNRSKAVRLVIVAVCGIILFLEYLPAPLHSNGDLYKDAPPVYKQLQKDQTVKLVAEYPFADIVYAPGIFTFQPMHKKILLNSSDGSISRGPFDSSIAGLNDKQTLGVLRRLKVDIIITHGFSSSRPGLSKYYNLKPVLNADGTTNVLATTNSYKIDNSVLPRDGALIIKKGYESLSVDPQQISHRFITTQATMDVASVNFSPTAKKYTVDFDAASACPASAQITITQSGRVLWSGPVPNKPTPIKLTVSDQDFYVKTAQCSIDVTNMSAEAVR